MSGTQEKLKSELVQDVIARIGTERKCTMCKETKKIEDFYLNLRTSVGVTAWCKKCTLVRSSETYIKNRSKRAMQVKIWQKSNPKLVRLRSYNWAKRNPERFKEITKKHYEKKRMSPKVKISDAFHAGLRNALRENKNGRHWEGLVGYKLSGLMKHLQKKFTKEMTWDNYGKYWHIDHKIPVSAFNYVTTDDIDFKRCWSLKNLQPLEKFTNLRKSDKLEKPFQPSLTI